MADWLLLWVVHGVVAGVFAVPLWIVGHRTTRWRPNELLTLVIPFSTWAAFVFFDLSAGTKTLANLVIEPGLLGAAVGLSAVVHVIPDGRQSWWRRAGWRILGLCVVAGFVYWLIPVIPE
jgi:hypothetical protein